MNKRLVASTIGILLAALLLGGSIVTFNFGLNEGLTPRAFQGQTSWWCECPGNWTSPVQIDKMLGQGDWFTLITFFVLAFLLVHVMPASNGRRSSSKLQDVQLTYPWAMPSPRWIDVVLVEKSDVAKVRIRRYKRIRRQQTMHSKKGSLT